MATESSGGLLAAVSDELAAAVESGSRSIVAVYGRRRIPATGIVWKDGIVVTADHVLEREEDITVSASGEDKIAATVGGRDPASDLAVLKITGAAPAAATLAPGGSLKVGNFVLALGAGAGGG